MPLCPVCAQDNPEVARFCLACGAALAPEVTREERKIVTVLFADLVGFTSRADRLDPEDVRAVLAPYWERLRSELERFGGTVEKFIGDAVMALFGAPVAHEDDPERAVRAALAIRDWAREEDGLQVRIAVTTGEALVLLGARPGEGEGMAAGDVVNTAARLQSSAPVNGVLVGEATYRATRDVIEYVEAEPVVAKGKADPINVWEALQARSRFGMDLEQRTLLPLVGRVGELETIVGALERARRDREPQLVTLVGVPGIGKSRLVAELFATLGAEPDLVWWRQGRALPYGEGVSFWALTEMVKAQAGIHENDSVADAEAKLRESVDTVVGPEDSAWVVEHLLPLLGLAPDAIRQGESFPAWRRYFEGLAEQHPLILVFEDLHWADDGLLDFVDHLVDWATGVPLLVLGTARPELLDRRPGWGGGKLNASTLALTPLADDDAARIIHGVLGQALLPAATQQELLERAGGNPLYAEQFARLYVERGSVEDLPLPETIQGIVAARLDGLTPEEKRLAQDASVVGKVFWAGALVELAGVDRDAVARGLHSLERKGLVRRERRSAVGGEEEFAFRHVLVRDVAYGQIPRADRSERHARAADWMERLGRLDDHAELLAHHLGAAHALTQASGVENPQLAGRARVALRRAGDHALALHAFAGAYRFYTDALALWPDDSERPLVFAASARSRFHATGEDDDLMSALDLLEQLGAVEEAAELAAETANSAWRAGRKEDAIALIERAQRLLENRPPSRALAAVLAEAGRLVAFDERHAEAETLIARVLELADDLGGLDELRASVLNTTGVIRINEGELGDGRVVLELAAEIAPPGSSQLVRALMNRSIVANVDGAHDEWLVWHRRAVEAGTRTGDRPMLFWLESAAIDGELYATGRWDEALARMETFIATAESLGGHYLEPGTRLRRAAILAARDDIEGAVRDRDFALAQLGNSPEAQYQMPILIDSAEVSLLLGDDSHARDLMEAAVARARTATAKAPGITAGGSVTITRCGFAEHFLSRFADAAATRRMTAFRLVMTGREVEAADIYAKISAEDEAVTRLHAGRLLAAAGRAAEADVHLQRALAFYRAAGASRIVREAEALFAAAS